MKHKSTKKTWVRGDLHPSNGHVFWSYTSSDREVEFWRTRESFDKAIKRERKNIKSKPKIKLPKENRWSQGDIHPFTGKIFWQYAPSSPNSELWKDKESYETSKNFELARRKKYSERYLPPTANRWKRGDVHPFTGKFFYCYMKSCLNGERWLDEESFKAAVNLSNDAARRNAGKYKDRVRAWGVKYQAQNREYLNRKSREYTKSTPLRHLAATVRKRTSKAIRFHGYKKESKTAEMIGCSWETLKSFIEARFKRGMSWDNYGQWHIDHIIPLSSAESESELKRLCHYFNLQPLWAAENIRKGDKIQKFQLIA